MVWVFCFFYFDFSDFSKKGTFKYYSPLGNDTQLGLSGYITVSFPTFSNSTISFGDPESRDETWVVVTMMLTAVIFGACFISIIRSHFGFE